MSWERSCCADGIRFGSRAVCCLALALIPGLPKLSFVLMADGVALMARRLPAAKDEATLLAEEAAAADCDGWQGEGR